MSSRAAPLDARNLGRPRWIRRSGVRSPIIEFNVHQAYKIGIGSCNDRREPVHRGGYHGGDNIPSPAICTSPLMTMPSVVSTLTRTAHNHFLGRRCTAGVVSCQRTWFLLATSLLCPRIQGFARRKLEEAHPVDVS